MLERSDLAATAINQSINQSINDEFFFFFFDYHQEILIKPFPFREPFSPNHCIIAIVDCSLRNGRGSRVEDLAEAAARARATKSWMSILTRFLQTNIDETNTDTTSNNNRPSNARGVIGSLQLSNCHLVLPCIIEKSI
jgi:hypothetical protein